MADEPAVAVDAAETNLIDMAAKMDAGEEVTPSIPEAKPDAPPVDPAKPAEPAEPPVEAADKKGTRERGPDGKFKAAEKKEEPAKLEEGQPPAQPKAESAYAKANKEQERQQNLLKNFEAEKKQVRAEAEALRKREQEIAAYQAQNRPEATLHGYTAREYIAAAQEYRKNGDYENALKAADAANHIRGFEAKHFADQRAQANDARFNTQMEKVLDEHAELKDPESAESKAVAKVLEEYPEVYYLENGFAKAHKLAMRLLRADSADDFETKLKAAEVELAKLRDATTPAIGGPSAPPAGPKSFNTLTPTQQESWLERKAGELDQVAAWNNFAGNRAHLNTEADEVNGKLAQIAIAWPSEQQLLQH